MAGQRLVHRLGGEDVAAGQGHVLFDHVGQLSDVAGPVVATQRFHGVRGINAGASPGAVGDRFQKMASQWRHVFRAFAQGRQGEGDHGQTVVQIFAKALLLDRTAQIAVGGRYHAHVDRQ